MSRTYLTEPEEESTPRRPRPTEDDITAIINSSKEKEKDDQLENNRLELTELRARLELTRTALSECMDQGDVPEELRMKVKSLLESALPPLGALTTDEQADRFKLGKSWIEEFQQLWHEVQKHHKPPRRKDMTAEQRARADAQEDEAAMQALEDNSVWSRAKDVMFDLVTGWGQ
mmetsp:Transcript_151353/g.275400  ORF Transcript_151353/g.275400 Transcript_151353/m.275400 type:complete len:174 (+) Transcript_151353:72-593(+)